MLSAMKERPTTLGMPTRTFASDLDLLREYRRVQMKLGRFPTHSELTEHGRFSAHTYARRFGGWQAFRQMMGDRIERHGRLTKAELITEYFAVKERLGRIPTGEELSTLGRYGKRTYHKHFGGHQKLLEFLKERDPATVGRASAPAQAPRRVHNEERRPPQRRPRGPLPRAEERRPPQTRPRGPLPRARAGSPLTPVQRDIVSRYAVACVEAGRRLDVLESVERGVCAKGDFLAHFGGFSSFLLLMGDAPDRDGST
jgi:hypothetical protein